jgi:hypothetical protein
MLQQPPKTSQIQQPVSSYLSSPGTVLTAENASQLLASMQPQPPSSFSQYYKQTATSNTPPKVNNSPIQSSPVQQGMSAAYSPSSTPKHQHQSPMAAHQMQSSGQFFSQSPKSQHSSPVTSYGTGASPTNVAKPKATPPSYYPTTTLSSSSSGGSARNQTISLPTVPVPSTSVFAGISPSIMSQAAVFGGISPSISQATTQNFLFSSLPQQIQQSQHQSMQIPVVQKQPPNAHGMGPNTTSSAGSNHFQQFINLPK